MIFLPLYAYTSIDQGSWTWSAHGSALYQMSMSSQAPQNDGDSITYTLYFVEGTYTMATLCSVDSNYGIVDFHIDGSEVGSMDNYSPSGGLNQFKNIAGINIGSSGIYPFKLVVDGKNGSSSGYGVAFQAISLYRTA